MSDLRVPTLRHAVTIACTDGRTFNGHIFLPAQSSHMLGPMSAEEWSDTAPPFFPFRARDTASSAIFSLEAVAAFTLTDVPPDHQAPHDGDVELPVVRVSVDAHGASFEGCVTIDMPPGRQRLADWLNAPAPFFIVRNGATHHLIQKRHVIRVVELDRISA